MIQARGLLRFYGRDLARIQRIADPIVMALLLGIIIEQNHSNFPKLLVLGPVLLTLLLSAILLPIGKLYQSYRQLSLWTLLRRISTSWALVLTGLLLFGFSFKVTSSYSRLEAISWALLSLVYLLVSHIGGRKFLRWHRSQGGNKRTVAFWGLPVHAEKFHHQLETMPFLGLKLVAWFQPPKATPWRLPATMPSCSGGLIEMRKWLQENDVDQIYFSYTSDIDLPMPDVIRFLGDTCKPVYYLPTWANDSMNFNVERIGSSYCISLWSGEESALDHQLKRALDLSIALAGVVLLSPLLLVLAALIRSDSPGPIFYLQDRAGLDGKAFKVYKFRTMTVTEDGSKPGLKQAQPDDPRVTRIGRVLRRWSLDELPQLFNVIEGSMSLVGPRPHAIEHNELYRKLISGYMQRHQLKPGMTGLAQVEGWRGETPKVEMMARRVEADLRYLRDWTIGLDLKILIKTVLHLRSPNAF